MTMNIFTALILLLFVSAICHAFHLVTPSQRASHRTTSSTTFLAATKKKKKGGGGGKKTTSKAFGSGGFGGSSSSSSGGAKQKQRRNLLSTLNDEPNQSKNKNKKKGMTYVKSEQDELLAQLAHQASLSPIGKAVADYSETLMDDEPIDQFWELIPSLISSKFPHVSNEELHRIAGFVTQTLNPNVPLEESIVNDPWRPHEDIHAYMPNLGETKPFHDPTSLKLCQELSDNIDVITEEYEALVQEGLTNNKGADSNNKDGRFQSVTSMNYDSGWKTLVLFYNGHRIPDFPYHLCPVTTRIMESVPLAGRIAGFNRQKPSSGIPLHSDGNNMWLTCQMGIHVPGLNNNDDNDDEKEGKAYIRVGPETRRWKRGECLLYDTTYEHETFNESTTEERVVLHVDFFNTLAMTEVEIEIMRYIYLMREEFMKAEGVAKVGAQIL